MKLQRITISNPRVDKYHSTVVRKATASMRKEGISEKEIQTAIRQFWQIAR